MIILFILGLALGATMVIFVLQNTAIITVSFFTWQFTGSLALVLMMASIGGIGAVLLMLLPESVSNYFKSRRLLKEIKRLEDELRREKERAQFVKETPPIHPAA